MRLSGVPITAIVLPPLSMAALCAAVSIPLARPDAMVYPSFTSNLTIRDVFSIACGEGSLVPTTATEGVSTRSHKPRKIVSFVFGNEIRRKSVGELAKLLSQRLESRFALGPQSLIRPHLFKRGDGTQCWW